MKPRIGIYNLFPMGGGGGEKRSVVMAERLSRNYDVSLIVSEPCSLSRLEQYFAVGLSRVRIAMLRMPVQHGLRRAVNAPSAALLRRARADLLLFYLKRSLEKTYYSQIHSMGFDVLINTQWSSVLRCPAPRGVYMCMFPQERRGASRGNATHSPFQQASAALANRLAGMTDAVLDSYELITANSEFTAGWIEKLWQRPSTVVYSACEEMGPASPKEKIILHAGRFVAEGRIDYKHQGTLLEVFRGMHDLHRQGWQLHFAGTVLRDANSRRMAARLRTDATGLPVFIHTNADFEKLRSLYRKASIYWHATGFGSSPETDPASQEHFGITVVEAMSAGAVPVVIDSGGLRETVRHGYTGFLWKDLAELAKFTSLLASDADLLRSFQARGPECSARFSRTAFADRMERAVESLLSSPSVFPGSSTTCSRSAAADDLQPLQASPAPFRPGD